MTDIAKFERLAELKKKIKELESEAKDIQSQIFRESIDNIPEKVKTSHGTLSLSRRQNYKMQDKTKVIETLGQETYNIASLITIPAIRKAAGEVAVNKLVAEGAFSVEQPTIYYYLRRE